MAGMAFANAFLGLNHSMAHKLGAFHHLPHGVANAAILTEVMRYNAAEVPTKMGTFSQYQYPHALARYAEIGRFVGCQGKDDAEVFENFIAKLEELKEKSVLRSPFTSTALMRNISWTHWTTWWSRHLTISVRQQTQDIHS